MSQLLNTVCLTKDQIKTVLTNLWKIRRLKFEEKIFEGKPSFSKDIVDKYGYKSYTKFADNYRILRCKSLEDNHNELFILVETDKYDKQNLLAISGFEHIIANYLEESLYHPRPTINLCLCFVITKAMKKHIPPEIFNANCFVRIFSLCSLYPLIGSKTVQYSGLTYDYEILDKVVVDTIGREVPHAYNDKEFSVVYADDPITIILNAVEGELICYKRIIHDTAVYSEYQIRRVVNKVTTLQGISKGGIPPPIPQSYLTIK